MMCSPSPSPALLILVIMSPNFSSPHYSSHSTPTISAMAAHGMKPPHPGFSGGSALLNTYLAMIAANNGNDAAVSAALNFQNGSMAAAQLSGMMPPMNGKDDRYGSDREDEGELGSDAENDDMSDTEDIPSSTALSVPINNGDHN